jgi:hypothetical protein
MEIWKVAAGGGHAAKVTRRGASEAFESPDGLRLYYVKANKGIWTAPLDDSEAERQIPELSSVRMNHWAVGKPGIFFIDEDNSLKLYDFATGRLSLRNSLPKRPACAAPCLSVSDDGSTQVWTQVDGSASDLILIDSPS